MKSDSDPIEEIEQLVSRLLDHSLSEDEAARLNSLMRECAEARERYQELLDNHEALCAIYPGDVYEAALDAGDALPTPPIAGAAEAPRILDARFRWLPWLAAAAVVELVLTFVFNREKVARLDEARAPSAHGVAGAILTDPVARVLASMEAEWEGGAFEPGSSLLPDTFHLRSGTVELELAEGVRLSIRGSAEFELVNGNRVHLTSGNLVARIPEQALGFLMTTLQSEVVDLGTEFGLEVNDAGQTDVHVINGLVEVYERRKAETPPTGGTLLAGIKIEEGQARRLETDGGFRLEDIPFHSRQQILGNQRFDDLGLSLLRGSIRVKDTVSNSDLKITTSGPPRIEVIPEKTGVLLEEETAVTFRSPGNYRYFEASGQMILPGAKVDSYLLHFRSTEGEPIRGVIKFDRPIVGLICDANQLVATDALGGLMGVNFPSNSGGFRGLEPHAPDQVQNPPSTHGGGGTPDEVTLSQDMTTLGLSVNVNPNQGVDQLRVLVLSKD
jgi:hypothetical protein